MSTTTEEDTELRDLVATTLENTGILGKIKAQLRANVYIALEEGDNVKNKSKLVNNSLISFLSTTNGRLIASLVREFLEFFNLDFTLAVFDPETNIGKDFKYRERSKLIDALGLTELTDTKSPLLSEIMRLSKVSVLKSETPTPTEISIEEDLHTSAQTSLNEDLNSKSLEKLDKSEHINSFNLADKSDRSETSQRSPNYSEDFSLSKGKNVDSDVSENSDSTTPEINLKDSSLNLLSSKPGILSSTFTVGEEENKKSDIFNSNTLKSKDPFLHDLKPLDSLGKTLGNLPPLTMPGRGLAPLSKIPTKSSDFDHFSTNENKSDINILSKQSDTKKDHTLTLISNQKNEMELCEKRSSAPSFGFDQDHVISEKSSSIHIDKKKSPVSSPDITENIEEELDSVLNSELSGADDFTKDETVKDEESLKADYVESL